ncbi:uncharacterized protein LOC141942008 [Strix uralensis]|uniref:uncharacterized protein LOC141942008 n=1 Tax=Strix uralensis TaxID=36305 RepID=UPI003DA7A5A5
MPPWSLRAPLAIAALQRGGGVAIRLSRAAELPKSGHGKVSPVPVPGGCGAALMADRGRCALAGCRPASRPSGGAAVRGRGAAAPEASKLPRGRQGAPPPEREGRRERGRGSRAPGVPAGLGAPAPGVPGPSWGCFPAAAAPGAAAASPRPGPSRHWRLRACSGLGPGRGCCGAGHRLRPRRARVPCLPGAALVAALTVPARGGRSWRAGTGGDAIFHLYRAASGSRDVAGRGKRGKPGKSRAEPGPFRPLAPHRRAPVRAGGTGRCPERLWGLHSPRLLPGPVPKRGSRPTSGPAAEGPRAEPGGSCPSLPAAAVAVGPPRRDLHTPAAARLKTCCSASRGLSRDPQCLLQPHQ